MLLECVAYRDGEPLEGQIDIDDLDTVVAAMTGKADFVWVSLQDPSYAELARLQQELALHPLAVEDAVSAHQRPKVEVYDEQSAFLVLRALEYDEARNEIRSSELAVFIGDHYTIAVRHGTWPNLEGVRDRIAASPELLQHGGAAAAAYHLVDAVVDDYQLIAEALTEDVDEVQDAVFAETPDIAESARVYLLKRELLGFRRAVMPLRDPLETILHGRSQLPVADELRPYLRDVADHLVHVRGTIESLNSLLDNVMQARATQISVQQNDDMRKLAAYAAMFAAPTLIAGVYGMNFHSMPELHWALGYPLALALMVVVVLLLWRAFKRSGWL